jgi:NAD(P)-dependent dehydrogenase (short-subunit alcohol dehydrogenase family)
VLKSVAIVTGASQGIGRATVIRLARDFEAVVLTARQADDLKKTRCCLSGCICAGRRRMAALDPFGKTWVHEDPNRHTQRPHSGVYGLWT